MIVIFCVQYSFSFTPIPLAPSLSITITLYRHSVHSPGLLTLVLSEAGLLWSLLLLLLLLHAEQLPPVLLQHSQLLLPRLGTQ